MCCIFTCCGWMIDLVQRLITFTMSCCIASAVVCSLTMSAMAGIALGYNYSLAEYVDLRETNVSVYLKRGMFDDEIADDMDWRRSAHLPVAGHLREGKTMITAAPEISEESGRRVMEGSRSLEDSILESNAEHKYEGMLMKLTAPSQTSTTTLFTPAAAEDDNNGYVRGQLDELKAVQARINAGKSTHRAKLYVQKNDPSIKSQYSIADIMADYTKNPRRQMSIQQEIPHQEDPSINPLRLAVPSASFHEWLNAPGKEMVYRPTMIDTFPSELGLPPGKVAYPSPPTPRWGPERPTRPQTRPTARPRVILPHTEFPTPRDEHSHRNRFDDQEIKMMKERLFNKQHLDAPPFSKDLAVSKESKSKNTEEYDEESIGIGVRRKRSLLFSSKLHVEKKHLK